MVSRAPDRRAACVALGATLEAVAPAPPRPRDDAPVAAVFVRRVDGAFLAPPGGLFGVPQKLANGPYVRLVAPHALALAGSDLLVCDVGAGRLLRIDLALGTLSAVGGAPTHPTVQLALGPDLSAWVLDPPARRLLRFARDGRLLQTLREAGAAPGGFALADGGVTPLVADAALRQWSETRPAGAFAVALRPDDGSPAVRAVDGIAAAGDEVFVLDRLAGAVHVVRRSGRILGQLGQGQLVQPQAIAADRLGRVWVHDAQALVRLVPGRPAQRFEAAALRVAQIGGFAVDARQLAVADRAGGFVALHALEAAP
jgi:hypothetical protein